MDIADVEKICKALPHVTVGIKWKSDLVYMVAEKMFCVVDLEAMPTSVAFKVPSDSFEELAASANCKPAPYFAQHKWVTVIDFNKIPIADLEQHIKTSYQLVTARLTNKVRKELGIDKPE